MALYQRKLIFQSIKVLYKTSKEKKGLGQMLIQVINIFSLTKPANQGT